MLSKIRRRSGGFTLIELMIVIAIIAILAAILVPNFIRARAQGQLTACKSNLKNIGTALEMYSTDWSGKYPNAGTAVLTPNYLKSVPECPATSSNTYTATFGPGAALNVSSYDDYYYVECTGQNHDAVSVTGNYPAYNGIQGLIERAP
jgi:prepilin-type N-terminal cleavage/methylation domain-containing protein